MEVDEGMLTLQDFRGRRVFKAGRGNDGEGNKRKGANGKAVTIKVPPGTIIRDAETNEIITELNLKGEKVIIAKGGKGGLGNHHFASPSHQTPRKSTPGQEGERKVLLLELRMIADIGVIGLPSAGKSSLVALVSTAEPKQAEYPFTTLVPKVGHIDLEGYYRVTIADLPGLIEDAHEGRGLGFKFLKHIQRTNALIHIIAWREEFADDPDEFLKDRQIILDEMGEYDPELLEKRIFTVINKVDLIDTELDRKKIFGRLSKKIKSTCLYFISIREKEGVENLIRDVCRMILENSGKLLDELPLDFKIHK